MSSQWGPTRKPDDQPGRVVPQWWLRPRDVIAVVAACYGGPTRPDRVGAVGLGASLRTEPPLVEPPLVDPTQEQRIVGSGRRAVDRLGPYPPLTPADLAVHVRDLVEARGQAPTLNENNRAQVETAAAGLLALLGVETF